MSQPIQQAAPPGPREADDKIILAFRTITTMLQVLQQLPSEEKKPMELRTRDERQELRVLGALATLLVQRYQVIAVTTGGSSGEVSLVACAEDSSRSATPDEPSSLTNGFITTTNPRRYPPGPDRITVIQEWETHADLAQPLHAILKNWHIGRCFEDHAQSVVDLLRNIADLHSTERVRNAERVQDAEHVQNAASSQEESACDVAEHNLLKYITGASFQKMYTRLKSTNYYSANFFNALMHLDNHWDQYDPNPPSTPKGEPKYSILDEDFLNFIVLNPDSDAEAIENLTIPHLSNLATAFRKSNKAVHHLYTKDTYREIHHLLCRLLTAYRERLQRLNAFRKTQGQPVQEVLAAFTELVIDVAFAGLWLHTMAYGSVLERHFEKMSRILDVIMQSKPWVTTTTPDDPEEHEHHTMLPQSESHLEGPQDDPESHQDSELIAVQPRTRLTETAIITVDQSFHKWSRLMVSYFEAYKIVVNFAKERKSRSLSLTIVKIPHQGEEMARWQDLADGPYDTVPQNLPMSRFATPSLRFAALDEPVVDLATDDAAWAAQLTAITNAVDFRRAVEYIKSTHSSVAKAFDEVAPLSVGNQFLGTVHCEAGLASLAYACNTKYESPDDNSLWFAQNINPFIGISKWCCPVCEDLLDVLQHNGHGGGAGKRFQVSGCHRTIYSCTLPPWLPHNVLVEMHNRYWHRLLGTLVEVVKATSLLRPTSAGSHAQSSISSTESKRRGLGWKNVFKLFKPRKQK